MVKTTPKTPGRPSLKEAKVENTINSNGKRKLCGRRHAASSPPLRHTGASDQGLSINQQVSQQTLYKRYFCEQNVRGQYIDHEP